MIQIIGWSLLHALWQITLIVGGYWVIKNVGKIQQALAQYYLGLSAMLLSLVAPLATFIYLWNQRAVMVSNGTALPEFSVSNLPIVPLPPTNNLPEMTQVWSDYLPTIFPYLVGFWGMGILFFSLRFWYQLQQVNNLQKSGNELLSGEWLAKVRTFQKQMGIDKNVLVYLSAQVKEPLTFGHFQPIILLPISLMTGFAPAAIETILLHELAHIKRHDYLVNVGQSIIEIILFFHPLVWWLSNEIRNLREYCCDDLVLSTGNNRTAYVETLTALQWRKIGISRNSLSLSIGGSRADFSQRIKRMFGVAESDGSWRQKMGAILLLLFAGVGGKLYQQFFFNTTEDKAAYEILITDKTTAEELHEWASLVNERGIYFDFEGSLKGEADNFIEVKGNFKTPLREGNFYAANLPCVNMKFILKKDRLIGPDFSYPCKEAAERKAGTYQPKDENQIIIDNNKEDLRFTDSLDLKKTSLGKNKRKVEDKIREAYELELALAENAFEIEKVKEKMRNHDKKVQQFREKQTFQFSTNWKPSSNNVQLIPPHFSKEDTINVIRPIYRPNRVEEKAKAMLVNSVEMYESGNESPISTVQIPLIHEGINVADLDHKNWIQWGDKKFPFSATFKIGRNGQTELMTPKFKFTKKEWEKYRRASLTFYIEEEWYKIKSINDIVLVPFKEDPTAVNLRGDFYKIIQQENHQINRLLQKADVGDLIYYETIDVGKDFTFGLVVEIVEKELDESTGLFIEPISSFKGLLSEKQPNDDMKIRSLTGQSVIYIVDDVPKYNYQNNKISPSEIADIDVVTGTKAQVIYGVDKAILIKTKRE